MTKEMTTKQENRLQGLLSTPSIKGRFEEMLGKRAPSFLSSIVSAVNANPMLKESDPMSIISAAAVAASMDLPINPSLGFAHIVPYRGKDGVSRAQFQAGWKAYVQLALRSGQYRTINATPVFEGQIKKRNQFTGDIEFNEEAVSTKVVGYLLYFRLLNGYEKYHYMTTEECEAHGRRYSRNYDKSKWKTDFEAMSLKTVIKSGLSKFGVLSVEMHKAIETDQAIVNEKGEAIDYPDAPEKDVTDSQSDKPNRSRTKPNKLTEAIARKVKEASAQHAPETDADPDLDKYLGDGYAPEASGDVL